MSLWPQIRRRKTQTSRALVEFQNDIDDLHGVQDIDASIPVAEPDLSIAVGSPHLIFIGLDLPKNDIHNLDNIKNVYDTITIHIGLDIRAFADLNRIVFRNCLP